jgi:hypothetical protein
MESQPKFIKEFSKQQSPEERNRLAQEIKDKRSENKSAKNEMSEREKALAEQLGKIKNLESEIDDLSCNGLSRLMNYLKLKSLKSQLTGEKSSHDSSQKDEIVPPDMEEPKRMLANFYGEQKKKWENSPYSKEDIDKNFSEEHLASLSIKDYALLMKRFPQEMVTHVTRQGIRDHVGHIYHTAGEGEYSDGFMKILQDGKLRSRMGVYLIEGVKEETIAKYLELERFKTEEEARDYLDKITDPAKQWEGGSYADKMAVHFATEEVANVFYGSEKDNEIFIAYPSAHVASQYHFDGQLNKSGGGYWNDQWVWGNEEKGMDINAGLVFIPKETRVDHQTGSRYEIGPDKKPVKNEEFFNKMQIMTEWQGFSQFIGDVKVALTEAEEKNMFTKQSDLDRRYEEKMRPFMEILEKNFGITESRLQKSILNFKFLAHFRVDGDRAYYSREINDCLESAGLLYKEAGNAISSKEYWEKYFDQHPEQRPSKIIYYEGNSPSDALYDWKKSNGLGRKSGDWSGELSNRKVERDSMEATSGLGRFRSIAEKVIDDYYDKKKTEEPVGALG